jgi:hypothetical protein
MNRLATAYNGWGIYFSVVGSDQINDDYYSSNWTTSGCDAKFSQLVLVNRNTSAVNIYLLDDNTWNQGRAESIPGLALVIGGKILNTPIVPSFALAHELGHCLNLFHTFHGCESGADCNGNFTPVCLELPDGSNCSTCGDFVCDTPADPFINFNTNGCSWNGTPGSTACIAANYSASDYHPDETNIMTYVPVNCMNHFTEGQANRMRAELLRNGSILNVASYTSNGTPNLNNIALNSNPVTGPTPVNSGSSNYMQVNPPNSLNPISSYSFSDLSGYGDMTVSLSPSGNSCYIYPSGTFGYRSIGILATNACGTSSVQVVLYIPTSYRAYPNPAQDKFTVQFADTQSKEGLPDQLEILNEKSSKPVRTLNINSVYKVKGFKDNSVTFDIGDLPRGTYYLRVTNSRLPADKQVNVIRIIFE